MDEGDCGFDGFVVSHVATRHQHVACSLSAFTDARPPGVVQPRIRDRTRVGYCKANSCAIMLPIETRKREHSLQPRHPARRLHPRPSVRSHTVPEAHRCGRRPYCRIRSFDRVLPEPGGCDAIGRTSKAHDQQNVRSVFLGIPINPGSTVLSERHCEIPRGSVHLKRCERRTGEQPCGGANARRNVWNYHIIVTNRSSGVRQFGAGERLRWVGSR